MPDVHDLSSEHDPSHAITPTDDGAGHTDDTTTASPQEWIGELVAVDPQDLVIGCNVRSETRLDPDFLRSIRDRGVQEPITAHRYTDGRLHVYKGKRRTLAACETSRRVRGT